MSCTPGAGPGCPSDSRVGCFRTPGSGEGDSYDVEFWGRPRPTALVVLYVKFGPKVTLRGMCVCPLLIKRKKDAVFSSNFSACHPAHPPSPPEGVTPSGDGPSKERDCSLPESANFAGRRPYFGLGPLP